MLAGDDADLWKALVLTVVRRRFHSRSPEARADAKSEAEDEAALGDGERLIFYVAFVVILHLLREDGHHGLAAKAASVLCSLAPLAGGSRDTCTLLELAAYDALQSTGLNQQRAAHGHAAALAAAAIAFSSDAALQAHPPLLQLVEGAAATLDSDLQLVRAPASDAAASGGSLMSTLHTFVPHNDRGSSKGESHRKLAQCIAEMLVWSRSRAAGEAEGFARGLAALRTLEPSAAASAAAAERSLHAMQAAARRLRKELNASARESGFSLCTAYGLDPSSVTLRMLRRGKAGDLAALATAARRAGDERMLKLLAARNADPDKAVKADSVQALQRSWQPLAEEGEAVDEVRALELQLQQATVRATVAALRKRLPSRTDRAALVASLDESALNAAAAVLVAAALGGCEWAASDEADGDGAGEARDAKRQHTGADAAADAAPAAAPAADAPAAALGEEGTAEEGSARARLFFKSAAGFESAEEVDVSTGAAVMAALDRIFARERGALALAEGAAAAATKEVQILIDRHLGAGESLMLFTSCDVKLPAHTMEALQAAEQAVHCHIGDEVLLRLQREGARVGDVTVSLAWSTTDDLDLHVFTPSGAEISYSNREAGGGVLDVDMNAGGRTSTEPVENIFLGDADTGVEAPRGRYKVVVQNYAYHTHKPHGAVPWKVQLRMNDELHEYLGECVGSGEASNVTAVEFIYAGRVAKPVEATGSAFGASNLVAVTTSVGYTLDALEGLMRVTKQHSELARVRELTYEPEAMEVEADRAAAEASAEAEVEAEAAAPEAAAAAPEAVAEAAATAAAPEAAAAAPEAAAEVEAEVAAAAAAPEAAAAATEAAAAATEAAAPRLRAAMASHAFDVTSRERLYLQLHALPATFHAAVDGAFGGRSLLESCAATVAERMVRDGVHVTELRRGGYPAELVAAIKRHMQARPK